MDMFIKCQECEETKHRRAYKVGSTICKHCDGKDEVGKLDLIREILSFKYKFQEVSK